MILKEKRIKFYLFLSKLLTSHQYEDDEEFIECSLNLSIMTMNVVCKDILVEKLDKKNSSFFWEDEQ